MSTTCPSGSPSTDLGRERYGRAWVGAGEHTPRTRPSLLSPPPPSVPPPSIFGRASRLAVKVAFLGLLGYGLYWMGRRTAGLVLSLPATQYCLQRASSARPHK